MPSKLKRIRKPITPLKITTIAITILIALTWISLQQSQRPELIDGKSVSQWIAENSRGSIDYNVIYKFGTAQDVAIPALLELLKLRDGGGANLYRVLLKSLPETLRSKLPLSPTAAELRAASAKVFILFGDPPYGNTQFVISDKHADNVISSLRAALKDQNDLVRLNASAALGHQISRPTQAIKACSEALNDSHKGVRINALYSLGHLAKVDRTAVAFIRQALKDSDPAVVKRASEEMGKLNESPVLKAP